MTDKPIEYPDTQSAAYDREEEAYWFERGFVESASSNPAAARGQDDRNVAAQCDTQARTIKRQLAGDAQEYLPLKEAVLLACGLPESAELKASSAAWVLWLAAITARRHWSVCGEQGGESIMAVMLLDAVISQFSAAADMNGGLLKVSHSPMGKSASAKSKALTNAVGT
jgi:hypothetical protein